MNTGIILCDVTGWPASAGVRPVDATEVALVSSGSKANVVIESIGPKIYERLGGLHRDLLRVAAFVYLGDRTIKRGDVDIYGERWHRNLHFVIAVSDPAKWNTPAIKDALLEAVSFASDDNYTFHFIPEKNTIPEQDFLATDFWGKDVPDVVSLFSGGLDSLSGVVYDAVKLGKKPLLVSHYPGFRHKSRQKRLVAQLRKLKWPFPQAQAQASLKNRHLDVESTQRARAFLYLTLGFVVASKLRIPELRMYENGVVALNLPVTGQSLSSTLTRTSHPKFVQAYQEFANLLLSSKIKIVNPLLFLTRTQVVERLELCGEMRLIPASTSCAHVYMMDNAHPHCGLCSQCLDRQVALINHDFLRHDTAYRYNPFIDDPATFPEKSHGRALSLGYFGTHLKVGNMSEPAFYGEFVDLHGALHYIPVAFDKTEKAVYELFQRQSRDVERAFLTIRNKYDKQLLHGNLPRECLLHSIGGRTHLEPQPQVAAEKMGMLAEDCLQAAFRTHKAIDEKNVQDVLEANYMQLKERVEREFPVYCVFHLKGVRPDFSNGQALVIEVKHIYGKNRTPQKIVEEMGSDISHYKDKVGGVLFIVYDPEGKIADKKRFTEECLRHANVYLKLIR